jgi:hypothetical protein
MISKAIKSINANYKMVLTEIKIFAAKPPLVEANRFAKPLYEGIK